MRKKITIIIMGSVGRSATEYSLEFHPDMEKDGIYTLDEFKDSVAQAIDDVLKEVNDVAYFLPKRLTR